jgi:hypothetical protein
MKIFLIAMNCYFAIVLTYVHLMISLKRFSIDVFAMGEFKYEIMKFIYNNLSCSLYLVVDAFSEWGWQGGISTNIT